MSRLLRKQRTSLIPGKFTYITENRDNCLSLLYFFFWPLCYLFFFDIRILITSLWYLHTLLVLCCFLCLCFVSRVQMLHVFLDCPLLIVPVFCDIVTRTPLKTGSELMYSRRVVSFCSTSGTRGVSLVIDPVISHECVSNILMVRILKD
jgi:hypothetical protein